MQHAKQNMRLLTLRQFRAEHYMTMDQLDSLVELNRATLEKAEQGEPIHWAYKEKIELKLSHWLGQPVQLEIAVQEIQTRF